MKRLLLLLFLTIFIGKLYGQPGGGGGLKIGGLYDKKGRKINLADPSLRIRAFALADSSANAKIIQELYLPDYLNLPPNFSNYQTANYFNLKNQRLWISYKKETMLLDFQVIIPENGAGIRDRMDSVVFRKGHFRYYRYPRDGNLDNRKSREYDKFRSHGFTPTTLKHLVPLGWITLYKKPNKPFLTDKNLLPTFYLRRGAHYVSKNEPAPALTDILKAMEMGLAPKEQEEALLLLSQVYAQKRDCDKAIKYISELMIMRSEKANLREYYGIEHIQDSYRNRIDLYIRNNQYDKALIDYDSLVSVSKYANDYSNSQGYFLSFNPDYGLDENIERARFKLKYLKDYKGAIADLKERINAIPEDHFNDRPQGWSEYSNTYFTLALAEYHNGEKSKAWKNWLKAMEFGYGQESNNHVVVHFDTLILKHPEVPELYLSRAIAHFKRAPYLGWGEETNTCFDNSLKDIDLAEKSGFADFRINLYRAQLLSLLKRHELALEQINIAIAKNNRDPRNYLQRYRIRDKLGKVNNANPKSDPDWLTYEALITSWKFEK